MAGQIHRMIQTIIEKRAKGDKLLAEMTKTKMIMKGININQYHESSPDDVEIVEKLKKVASELGISL